MNTKNPVIDKSAAENPTPPAEPVSKGTLAELRSRLFQSNQTFFPVVVGLVLIALYFQTQNDAFLSSRNISNLILQVSMVGIVSAGSVLVLLTGEIDLSVGSCAGVSAAVFAIMLVNRGQPILVAILAAFAAGAAVGLLNAFLSTIIGAPSFVVTLAALLGWQGVQLQILNTQTINVFDDRILSLATTYLTDPMGWVFGLLVVILYALPTIWDAIQRQRRGLEGPPLGITLLKIGVVAVVAIGVVFRLNQARGVPILGILFITVVAGLASLMKRTRYGRYIYAVGNSREGARRAGVNVTAILASVFVVSALLASLGGLVALSREASATTLTGGDSFLLEVIAAAVIGGTSLFGGRGTVWSALLGALVIGSLSNGLDLMGQSGAVKLIVEGIILALAISADALIRRRSTS